MTEKETPMPQRVDEETVKDIVWRLCEKYDEQLFQDLDDLHKRNITDTDVIRALREGGYAETASAYIEWGGCIDPDSEGNETLDTVVPDPVDAPSYAGHPLNQTAPRGDQ